MRKTPNIFGRVRTSFLTLFCFLAVSACQVPTTSQGYRTATDLTQQAGWQPRYLETPHFTMQAYLSPVRAGGNDKPVVIYIEGDGFSWITARQVSPDPTPLSPFMLEVALADRQFNAVYLARPCQYVIAVGHGANCRPAVWTDGRFNSVVIDDVNVAIDQALALRQGQQGRGIVLVGGSGGGTVAMLVASRRTDVIGIVTLSGLLNHKAWSDFHRISPLVQSLNPVDLFPNLAKIPQKHFLAEKDDVVPVALSLTEISRLRGFSPDTVSYEIIPGISHDCCWDRVWSGRYAEVIGTFQSMASAAVH